MNEEIYHLSKANTEKLDLLWRSINKATKNCKTPNEIIDSLINWAYKYHNVFLNSHQVLSRNLNYYHLTLKNGTAISDYNSEYVTINNAKKMIQLALVDNDYGDIEKMSQIIHHALKKSRWYYQQNPLTAFTHHAKPITMKTAEKIVKEVKKSIGNTLDLLDPHTALKQKEAKIMQKEVANSKVNGASI